MAKKASKSKGSGKPPGKQLVKKVSKKAAAPGKVVAKKVTAKKAAPGKKAKQFSASAAVSNATRRVRKTVKAVGGVSQTVIREARRVPAAARDAVEQVKTRANIVGHAVSVAADTVTQSVATAAGIVVGAVESVLPTSHDAPDKTE